MLLISLTAALLTLSSEDLAGQVENRLRGNPSYPGVTWTLEDRMRELRIPAVSIAVFRDFELVWAKAYGVRDARTQEPVDEETVFQAASISKSVNAMGFMALHRDELLDLDNQASEALARWNFPQSRARRPVLHSP